MRRPAATSLPSTNTALALFILGSMSGCGYVHTGDAAPGDAVQIRRRFYYAFRRPGGETADTSGVQTKRYLLQDASWQAPPTVHVESRRIEISQSDIAGGWPTAPSHVAGIEVQVSCVAHIDQNARPGEVEIKLGLPGLARLGVAVDAKPSLEKVSDGEVVFLLSPEEVTSAPNTYQIRRLTVSGSASQRNVHAVTKLALNILPIAAFAVLSWIVAKSIWSRKKQRDRVSVDGKAR
jgi:hypothetical protein